MTGPIDAVVWYGIEQSVGRLIDFLATLVLYYRFIAFTRPWLWPAGDIMLMSHSWSGRGHCVHKLGKPIGSYDFISLVILSCIRFDDTATRIIEVLLLIWLLGKFLFKIEAFCNLYNILCLGDESWRWPKKEFLSKDTL